MTQPDNLQQEVARLTQRQDQLEQQQRETTTTVDALKSDVDSRIDSLRRDMDQKYIGGERRLSSLESSRDSIHSLTWYAIVFGWALAMTIIMVMIIVIIVDA